MVKELQYQETWFTKDIVTVAWERKDTKFSIYPSRLLD